MWSPRDLIRRQVYMPWARIPRGRMIELPGRGGSTYVTDTPGPDEHSPTIVLLHALGCTGLLTWYPTIEPFSRRYRVVTLDQRWHGQGIRSEEFSLYDCADDVAALIDVLELEDVIVCGYSLGSIVAQRVWRQHREKIQGLVLCATTDRFQLTPSERVFFTGMGVAMFGARGISRSRTALTAARATARALDLSPSDIHEWALHEFRSTSPWAIGQALAALGQHHSRPWITKIDVPTAVVVGTKDRVIEPSRQLALAQAIPGATVHDVDAGHAMCVLEAEKFVPVVVEAVNTVNARRRDFGPRGQNEDVS
jgi:3-oxoadipate enol-lactonase